MKTFSNIRLEKDIIGIYYHIASVITLWKRMPNVLKQNEIDKAVQELQVIKQRISDNIDWKEYWGEE